MESSWSTWRSPCLPKCATLMKSCLAGNKHWGATKVASLKGTCCTSGKTTLNLDEVFWNSSCPKSSSPNTVWPHVLPNWNCVYLSMSAFLFHPSHFACACLSCVFIPECVCLCFYPSVSTCGYMFYKLLSSKDVF